MSLIPFPTEEPRDQLSNDLIIFQNFTSRISMRSTFLIAQLKRGWIRHARWGHRLPMTVMRARIEDFLPVSLLADPSNA